VEALYQQTLEEVWKIHAVAEEAIPCELEPGFNEALYRWEQHYFFEHFLLHSSRLPPGEVEALYEGNDWKALAQDLASRPRYLVHRDFQSRNVMIRDGKVYLIDYQGLRWGRPEYDLASLLLDPYVDLDADQRQALLQFYHQQHRQDSWEDFMDLYWRCAAQRLMQALGAYGNLGRRLGKEEFLAFIPVALPRLRQVLESGNLLPNLREALEDKHLKPRLSDPQ
jgi:aminoglycoside/choline kinase family phosphotransferase